MSGKIKSNNSTATPVNFNATMSALRSGAAEQSHNQSVNDDTSSMPVSVLPVDVEKTMISVRMLKSDKEKFFSFFKAHGLSFTDGIYMAADFIEREVKQGRLSISKSGIIYK